MRKIRVLVVDDSAFLRRNLPRIIELDPRLQVIDTAQNGLEAIEKTKKLRPDVITLDVIMPVMDGLAALKRIMRETPTPVLMLSSMTHEGARQTMEALTLGAVDYLVKPSGPVSLDISTIKNQLIQKIKTVYAGKVNAITGGDFTGGDSIKPKFDLSGGGYPAFMRSDKARPFSSRRLFKRLVAIAASTGGPAALQVVLANLPADLPAGVVIVQHISEGFSRALAERLNSVSPLDVKLAQDQDLILPGQCLVIPAGKQMGVEKREANLAVRVIDSPPGTIHKPSADILFSSLAETCAPETCAVILTGMGADGADGIGKIRDCGGVTIAQDEASSIIFGMPKAAIERGGIDRIVSLDKIGDEIMGCFR